MGDNVVDKITNDDTKIVITNRSVKWIIGLLVFGVTGLLGFAWGLYVTLDGKVDDQVKTINDNMESNKVEIINRMEELDKNKVERNSDKNYKQDMDIVRLYERTDSRSSSINGNSNRPEIIEDDNTSLPSLGQ